MCSARRVQLLFALLLGGCAGTSANASSPAALRPLEEVRAQRAIETALAHQGMRIELHRTVQLTGRRQVELDAAISGTRHGIEYVSAGDRILFGASLPERRNPAALLVAPGMGSDQGSDFLVLDEGDFLYEPDPNRQGPGHPLVQEVEDRVQRAVIDYITYLRDNHRL